jgi:hypothetical protein
LSSACISTVWSRDGFSKECLPLVIAFYSLVV